MILAFARRLPKETGINPQKVIFCHMDSYNMGMGNPTVHISKDGYDLTLPEELCKLGYNIGFDTWSRVSGSNEETEYALDVRMKMLMDMVSRGWVHQISLGHDMMSKGDGVQNGRGGYITWPEKLKTLVRQRAITKEDFDILTVDNPARILTVTK